MTATRYLCHSGNLAVWVSNAPWGGTCLRGGVKVESGVDDDGDGVLSDAEVDTAQYVCNLYMVQVATGFYSTCALLSDGTVRCWGRNLEGQLGGGTTADASSTPVVVPGLKDVTAISLGGYFGCALLSDGTVRCWGQNTAGQLGDGTQTSSATPVPVSGLTGAVEIACGGFHCCARLQDGTASCWGSNNNGQLGDGTTSDSHTPVLVADITRATGVSLRTSFSCALIEDGTARCWGNNYDGQIGDGTFSKRTTPVPVLWDVAP